MSSQMNLSELTTQQLTDLLWVLKGTPQAQALYQEYSSRAASSCVAPDDPDWENKISASLQAELSKPRIPSGEVNKL